MTEYVLRRLLQVIPSAIVVMAITFVVFRMIPGDPVQFMLGANPRPEAVAALRHKYGLDRPVALQFIDWTMGVARGDLGASYVNDQPVLELILEKLPATLQLSFMAILMGAAIGLPLGVLAALKHNRWPDTLIRVVSLVGFSIPGYWLAILIVMVASIRFQLIPPAGYVSLGDSVGQSLRYAILPSVALAIPIACEQMRFVRASMLDVIRQDYVRTARAKGLLQNAVIWKHALKNALIPYLTILGLQLAFLLGGSVVIEHIAAWPGIGWLTLQAIYRRDYAIVQGVVLFSALAFLLINLLVDVAYTVVDPRIRYA